MIKELKEKIQKLEGIPELTKDQVLEVMNWEKVPGVSEDATHQFNQLIKNQREIREILLLLIERQESLEVGWGEWLGLFTENGGKIEQDSGDQNPS